MEKLFNFKAFSLSVGETVSWVEGFTAYFNRIALFVYLFTESCKIPNVDRWFFSKRKQVENRIGNHLKLAWISSDFMWFKWLLRTSDTFLLIFTSSFIVLLKSWPEFLLSVWKVKKKLLVNNNGTETRGRSIKEAFSDPLIQLEIHIFRMISSFLPWIKVVHYC